MFAFIIFGAICFNRMGVSELPDVDFPIISLSIKYEGAAPEVVEADVIDPIEDAVVSIQGVKNITSTVRNGGADLVIEFSMNRSIDQAFEDVQAKIAQTQAALPKTMDPITIMKINPSDFPIMWLSVSNPTMSTQDLMIYVKDHIRDKLTTVPGVGSLWMPGYLEPNLRVWVDNKALNKYALSASDVINTIATQHLEPPSGRAEYDKHEISLRTMGEATSSEDFSKILINSRGGEPNFNPIPLLDVASVQDGVVDVVQFARANGQPAVGLGVVKQRGANAVEVARAVKKRVAELEPTLSKGTKFTVNYDGTRFVEESINELVLTLVLAALLTSLVCWLFLGSWAATLNVLLAIPTSTLGTFIILYFSGFTLNVFTLLGLSLAIGIVVDDAIMVLENIVRHRQLGLSREESARVGAREITFAAIATSLSLVAIFLPIAFVEGLIGKFLFQFGVTMSAAVMISLLEALTLTPMRASRFADTEKPRGRFGQYFESLFEKARVSYERGLSFCLNHRWKVLGASLLFFILSFGVVTRLKGEFQPPQDQGFMVILLNNQPGSSITYTDEKVKVVEDFLSKRPETETTFVAAGGFSGGEPHNAMIFVGLKPKGSRGKDPVLGHELSQQEFIQVTRDYLSKAIPESKPQVQDPSTQGFGGSAGSKGFPAEFSIQGPDWKTLGELSKKFEDELRKNNIMTDVHSDLQDGAPEIRIVPNREKASKRGVDVASIGTVINAMLGGTVAGTYEKDGHRYDIRVKMKEDGRSPQDRIHDLMVRNNRGELVPLSSVVDVVQSEAPATISRKNRARSIMIYGNLGKGKSQQQVINDAKALAKKILPEGYSFALSGSAEEMQSAFLSMILALVLGFLVAYMILASQFDSFIDPITVFMALPFSFSGAFLGLWIGGQSMNMFSMIGLILLMGIVKKNSILLVDFTNQRRDEGLPVRQALMQACPTRLRPILMTSFATIAGALPAALAFGPGAESRRPMAIAVIGGVLVSTFLTLFVVPCVYSLFARFDKREKKFAAHAKAAAESVIYN